MANVRHGIAKYPGVGSVAGCTYTLSHGITPGIAILRVLPQTDLIAEFGNLILDDGFSQIIIPDAKLMNLKVQRDGDGGFVWCIEIADRRWRWQQTGRINGEYNLLDKHNKLIPWFIRSPTELAALCLQAMGESGFSINMPYGLGKADGANWVSAGNPPWIGVTPVNGNNPPVRWNGENPASALASLCELFGRRVIYRLGSDSVMIDIPGEGASLPGGSVSKQSPSLKDPLTPSGVAVQGGQTKYQCKLLLEAVGQDWDGSYRPLKDLSYAPQVDGTVQIGEVDLDYADGPTYRVWINSTDNDPTHGVLFSYTSVGGDDADAVKSAIAAKIVLSANPRIAGVVKIVAVTAGQPLTITGVQEGQSWSLYATSTAAGMTSQITQPAQKATGSWKNCIPPSFGAAPGATGGVHETDRLTLLQALTLAQKSVYRCYRLADVGPTGSGPIPIPGVGFLTRKQQIILLDTKVEQVTPEPGDVGRVDKFGQPYTVNFYNGYSRDKPAAVTGSIFRYTRQAAIWQGDGHTINTDATDQILIPFGIDPVEQVVTFGEYIYRWEVDQCVEPTLILETGVNIRDADTNWIRCLEARQPIPGAELLDPTFDAMKKYPDIQLQIVGIYDLNNNLVQSIPWQDDTASRVQFYLDGMTAQYLALSKSFAQTVKYNGLMQIDCDGLTQQITWEVGEQGSETTASQNTEHHPYIPPYPNRRHAEFLGPAAMHNIYMALAAAAANGSNPYNPLPAGDSPNIYVPMEMP